MEEEMINFNVPPFTGREMEYIRNCVESQKICGDGAYTKKCNEWLEKKTGSTKCLLTTSCTHATEMAALLAEIQPGDEVIMPAYTFVSTAGRSFRRAERSTASWGICWRPTVQTWATPMWSFCR